AGGGRGGQLGRPFVRGGRPGQELGCEGERQAADCVGGGCAGGREGCAEQQRAGLDVRPKGRLVTPGRGLRQRQRANRRGVAIGGHGGDFEAPVEPRDEVVV